MRLSEEAPKPIGGYFELELPQARELPYSGLVGFQSARAAFLALLRAGRPDRVWMPKYLCNVMVDPLEASGIECAWYDLDERLGVATDVRLASRDWLLCVNYFGLCAAFVADTLQRFSPEQVVLDYSQAFFSPPSGSALATIYSPRKFFGVPDGGLLYSNRIDVPAPEVRDTDSLQRSEHLLRRLAEGPEAGYAAYQEAEASLGDCEPRGISRLTERILGSIDYAAVARQRDDNLRAIHDKLGALNLLPVEIGNNPAPLCYPFRTCEGNLRQRLLEGRVFTPTYWTDALERLDPAIADDLVGNLIPLPIDQRCEREDIERLVSIILEPDT